MVPITNLLKLVTLMGLECGDLKLWKMLLLIYIHEPKLMGLIMFGFRLSRILLNGLEGMNNYGFMILDLYPLHSKLLA